ASPCTGRGLASRRVTTTLVGSYPTFSPLPPASPERCSPEAVSFLCHFPSAFAAWGFPSVLPCGVRTFLGARKRRGHPACILIVAPGSSVSFPRWGGAAATACEPGWERPAAARPAV